MVAGKRLQVQSFQQNLQNKPVGREETFLQTFLSNHVEHFSVQIFCVSFWKCWKGSPSSWHCIVVPRTRNLPTTSLDEKCIELEIQTDRSYDVDLRQMYLALKLKLVKGLGYETYEITENEKELKEEAKTGWGNGGGEGSPRGPTLNWHSIFSNDEVYINHQHFQNSNGLYAHKSYTSINFKGAFLNTREFCTLRVTTMKNYEDYED